MGWIEVWQQEEFPKSERNQGHVLRVGDPKTGDIWSDPPEKIKK